MSHASRTYIAIFVLVSTCTSLLVFGCDTAKAADEDLQTWTQIMASGPLDDGPWRARIGVQLRFSDNSTDLDRMVFLPAIGRRLGSGISAYAGYVYQPILQTSTFNYNWKNEHRPYQELRSDHVLPNGWSLTNRVRIEQRFIDGVGGEPLVRSRYLLRAVIPLDEKLGFGIADEVFFNLNGTDRGAQQGFDQNRTTLSLILKVDRKVTYEVGYMNNWIHSENRVDRDNHVLWLSTAYNWD